MFVLEADPQEELVSVFQIGNGLIRLVNATNILIEVLFGLLEKAEGQIEFERNMLRESGEEVQDYGLAGFIITFHKKCLSEIHLGPQIVREELFKDGLVEVDG